MRRPWSALSSRWPSLWQRQLVGHILRHLHSKSLLRFWACEVPPASNHWTIDLGPTQGSQYHCFARRWAFLRATLAGSKMQQNLRTSQGARRQTVEPQAVNQPAMSYMIDESNNLTFLRQKTWETYLQNPQVMLAPSGAKMHVETCHGCMSVLATRHGAKGRTCLSPSPWLRFPPCAAATLGIIICKGIHSTCKAWRPCSSTEPISSFAAWRGAGQHQGSSTRKTGTQAMSWAD